MSRTIFGERRREDYKFSRCSGRLVRDPEATAAFPISAEETEGGREGHDKRAKEMDRKRTVRGGWGILFEPRLTSAPSSLRHFGRNRDREFNSSPYCNALTPCRSYTAIPPGRGRWEGRIEATGGLKCGNAYKFKRLYGAKGGNPRDHSVYICVLRLNAVQSLYCVADDAGVQFNLTNGAPL